MEKITKLEAVFTGDSTNYHIFQVVSYGYFVGSMYVLKKSENGIPKKLDVSLVTPTSNKKLWLKGINTLISNAREGSKAEQKLIKTLNNYK